MNKILLDTNGYSSFLKGDENILDILSEVETVYMSVIVLGELYAGFKGGNREKHNFHLLGQFLSKPTVSQLDVTKETSEIFGIVKDSLKQAGTPLPINDIWIASHAIETGSVVVTYDQHFNKIPGIRVVS